VRFSLAYAKAVWHNGFMANVISMEKKVAVVSALVEDCSVRSIVRMTGVSKGAVLRLLESVGTLAPNTSTRLFTTSLQAHSG